MSAKKLFFLLLLSSILGGILSLLGFWWILKQPKTTTRKQIQTDNVFASRQVNIKVPDNINFTNASQSALPSVVHIKVKYANRVAMRNEEESYQDFENDAPRNHHSSGSGVIVSEDGYVVTNRHVINDATTIDVILFDKRSYTAELIGADPSTDLALLKIDENSLPFLKYGNSDQVQIGEWVVAIGNPFDLVSTVTAGIVSAKGRSISLLDDNYSVEAFIQTDAAVNPGNSGGALINTKGELVGINTAIATQTGFFAGYSFAIPVNLVRKISDDLMNYGESQRAVLGVSGKSVTAMIAEKNHLSEVKGVILMGVTKNGVADVAGLKKNDVIIMVDSNNINNLAELQTEIALKRPGDKMKVTFWRDNKKQSTKLTLLGKNGEKTPKKSKVYQKDVTQVLGANMRKITAEEKKLFDIDNGVKILMIGKGKFKECGFRNGFIITEIKGKQMKNVQDIQKMLQDAKEKNQNAVIKGIYPNGTKKECTMAW
ncbi:MAG: PDZ domain-containing protein [Bacteroidetes bacterium]|nr:MAG: PDZ domain-containing protein [Bacteroidota bacterium]TAG90034.1 MAG: PDZ domain-containing protein [Bacteroidota bacterium]